jgi:hypothetical protein
MTCQHYKLHQVQEANNSDPEVVVALPIDVAGKPASILIHGYRFVSKMYWYEDESQEVST